MREKKRGKKNEVESEDRKERMSRFRRSVREICRDKIIEGDEEEKKKGRRRS